jgi:glutaredoxin 3
MAHVVVYLTPWCPYCHAAERLLEKKGVRDIERIRVDGTRDLRREMEQRSGRYTVPQIFINEYHVGGFDDLAALERSGRLDSLLAGLPAGDA